MKNIMYQTITLALGTILVMGCSDEEETPPIDECGEDGCPCETFADCPDPITQICDENSICQPADQGDTGTDIVEDAETDAVEDAVEDAEADAVEDVPADAEEDTDEDVPADAEADTDEDVPADAEADTDEDVPADAEEDTDEDVPADAEEGADE